MKVLIHKVSFHLARHIARTLVCVFVFSFAANAQQARAWLTIISTTDTHGNILPIDYYTNKPDAKGLAKAATIIKQIRKENPNSLLIDSGDTIQGTPLVYYHHTKDKSKPDPMMRVMSALNYDAATLGNHEFNFGLGVLDKAKREARFPLLSANTYRIGTNENPFTPFVVKTISGVRVGILGLTTAGIPAWENKENYAGLEFRDSLAEAKKWVAILKDKERCDVVVIAMHMGLEADLHTGETSSGQVANENAAIQIARQVAGVDVISMGHTHRDVPSLVINNVQLVQANFHARHVGRIDLYMEKDARDKWRIEAKSSRTIPVLDATEIDAEIAAIAKPYDADTQRYLSRVIGSSGKELTAEGARFQDNALLDLIHQVQLDAGRADVSMAASFNDRARIAQGAVTVRDIAALYVYENTLVVLEVTGQQLKDALEHAARYFVEYEAGKTPAELVNPKVAGYNFDIAEGVEYEIDLSKPYGSRITNLTLKNKPLAMSQKLKLATNNYRTNGGGGYTMYKDAPVLMRSGKEIRELIIEWVERHKTIPPTATNNWKIVTN